MTIRISALTVALVFPLALAAQTEDQRFNEIRARHTRGEKITEDERDYVESRIERRNQEESAKRNAEYAKAHPPHESTGLVPLTELGKGLYKGEQGGLYPGGANKPPAAHQKAGLWLASEIVPLDREGRKSPDGRIVLCTIGMSNTTQESRSFLKLAAVDRELNPQLTMVDCAQGAQTAANIADPHFPYWKLVSVRLATAQVTERQVQVVWLKEANAMPSEAFPEHVR